MEVTILDQHQQQFPHLVTLIDSMRVYNSEKLWKQLSDTLLQYIRDPHVSEGNNLKDLYEGFVHKFHHEIDEYKLVRFVLKAADQYGAQRIQFLEKFNLSEQQAKLMLQIKKTYYDLEDGKIEEVSQQLKQFKKQIERIQDVEPLLYTLLYYLAFNFYRVKQNYEEFYINALQYLAYTPEDDMQQQEKVNLSLEMAYAVLISPQIYNYSELLNQNVLLSLKDSPHAWVYSLLETFNQGDFLKFQAQIQQFDAQIKSVVNSFNIDQPQLVNNSTTLHEKIRIMAFVELAFTLPKNNRVATFEQISQVTHLDINLIEQLVMRTISKGLVKGSINQIRQTVSITYIVPRILSIDKIAVMLNKFEAWEKTLQTLLGDVQTKQASFN